MGENQTNPVTPQHLHIFLVNDRLSLVQLDVKIARHVYRREASSFRVPIRGRYAIILLLRAHACSRMIANHSLIP